MNTKKKPSSQKRVIRLSESWLVQIVNEVVDRMSSDSGNGGVEYRFVYVGYKTLEDFYDRGEGSIAKNVNLTRQYGGVKGSSVKELVDKFVCSISIEESPYYFIDEDNDMLLIEVGYVNANDEPATDAEKSAWEQGQAQLWIGQYWCKIATVETVGSDRLFQSLPDANIY